MNLRQLWPRIASILLNPGFHRDAIYLSAATMISGLGGLVYWKLITLRFPAEMVGLVAAGITSATFLGALSNLGLTSGLVRFLPEQNRSVKAGLIRAAVFISFIAAVPVCLLFLGGRQWWAPALVPKNLGIPYIFIFSVLLFSFVQININSAVIQAQRCVHYLLIQSLAINTVQILGAFLISIRQGVTGILFTYLLPIFVVAIGFSFFLPTIGQYRGITPNINSSLLRILVRYSLSTQIFSILWQIPAFVFPLITLKQLGAEANAGFVLSWYAYSFLAIIPNAVGVTLLVDGSHKPGHLRQSSRDAILLNLGILIPLVGVILVFAPWLLGFFGPNYIHATMLLRLLALSTIPLSINSLYIALLRISKEMLQLNLLVAMSIVVSVGLAYILIRQGMVDGIGWGWLGGQSSFALVSFTLILREIGYSRKRNNSPVRSMPSRK